MKIKVLFLTNSYSGGGAENAVTLMLKNLNSKDLLITLMNINENIFKIDTSTLNFNLIELNRKKKSKITFIKAFLKFAKYITLNRPDIVVAHCELPELFTSLIPRNIKTIICVHSTKSYSGHQLIGKIVRFIHILKKSYWVRISNNLTVAGINSYDFVTIENPIDTNFSMESNQKLNHKNLKRLVFIGRISKIAKRPDLAIEIANKLNLNLILIGDGDWKEELKISNSNNKNISFVGFKPNPWQFIEEGDLILVTSDWEGEPLLLFEAYLNKVPILLRDIPELTKFDFDPKFYCKESKDFIDKIEIIRNGINLNDFLLKSKKFEMNISSKNPTRIAKTWERYLIYIYTNLQKKNVSK